MDVASKPSLSPEGAQYGLDSEVDITAAFRHLNINSTNLDLEALPQPEQCAAHLKLLEALHDLREEVSTSDGLFGLFDSSLSLAGSEKRDEQQVDALDLLKQKRWAIYIARAVDRFSTWWQVLLPCSPHDYLTLSQTQPGAYLDSAIEKSKSAALKIDRTNLPPLDVLMVWHAYTLNPRTFLEDCLRQGKMGFWASGLPWQAISDSIDSRSFDYSPGDTACHLWKANTGLEWDNLHGRPEKMLKCLGLCQGGVDVVVPWSTTGDEMSRLAPGSSSVLETLQNGGTGYADRDFEAKCPQCNSVINHDLLRVSRFMEDLMLLLHHQIPLPGTVLSTRGRPESVRMSVEFLDAPNRILLQTATSNELVEQFQQEGSNVKMEDVRQWFDSSLTGFAKHELYRDYGRNPNTTKAVRRAIRRMIGKYWDNHSVFSMDLQGAVLRQCTFIEKMHKFDWLHSLTLRNTMERLVLKYTRFFTLLSKGNLGVPTLDVDLAWHTHQTMPFAYYSYSIANTVSWPALPRHQGQPGGDFIDHDDAVSESKLSDAFAWTSKEFEKRFGVPYSECTCWYCEAVRESFTAGPIARLFDRSSNKAQEETRQKHLSDAPSDPECGPHISAHNVVRPPSEPYRRYSLAQAIKLQRDYDKACKRAAKKGRNPPGEKPRIYRSSIGPGAAPVHVYPYTVPLLLCYQGMYACNPACVSGAAPGGCAAAGANSAACGGGGCASANCAGASSGFGSCGAGGGGCGGGGGGCGGGGGGGGGCGGGGGGG